MDDMIDYPIEGLDMSKHILNSKGEPQIYDLFAVSNHYGSLNFGHYTATCKNLFDDQWYDFNDSSVSRTSLSQVVSNSAYVLYYMRRGFWEPKKQVDYHKIQKLPIGMEKF